VETCSYKSQYWNFEVQQIIEFRCKNKTELESGKCVFHDEHFLGIKGNRKIVVEEFQNKIDKYLSTKTDEPLLCIGYHLFDINIQGREFNNSVYFDEATISNCSIFNSKFLSHMSLQEAQFSGDVYFVGTQFSAIVNFSSEFSGEGHVTFSDAQFLGQGDVDLGRARFLG
jgi:uncharacterized protein YjbI with pentapeptide repeats